MNAVRYVGVKGCKHQEYLDAIADSDCAVINMLRQGGNVTFRFEIDGKPLEVSLDRTRRDFADFAACIYILDEVLLREKSEDGWTRPFDVIFPVHDRKIWEAAGATVERMLWTLAGDSYRLAYLERGNLPGLGPHRRSVPSGYDAVCLFSGGIDSLLGAYKLLTDGKHVLLVGHQADNTAAAAQTELARKLNGLFPPVDGKPRLRLIQCRLARSMAENHRFVLPDKCEESHRPRSLLFLSLAVAIAGPSRVKEIYIPENGLIALNPALQKSRLGTLSTRTAHPLFLAEFCDLAKMLGLFEGPIRNPFLYQSKTDMLNPKGFDLRLKPLLWRSISCARPSKYKDKGVRHCGYCVPCIYRRISMMELDLDASQDYAFDVFSDLSNMSALTQLDFRALVSFAKRVVKSSATQRELMLFSHGAFSSLMGERFGPTPTPDFKPWSDMLLRWATDFIGKVCLLSAGETKKIVAL